MDFDYCFMKRVPCAFIFVLTLVTACSTAQQTTTTQAPEPPPGMESAVAANIAVNDLPPTDPDVMYHVMAAEVLGAEGDFSGAAAEYLEAALASNDPEIAERAARVAVSANEWQMVALASDRWAMLKPSSLDAHQLAAGSRLREGDYVGAEFQLARILELTEFDPSVGWGIVTALLAPANDHARANKVLNNLLERFDAISNADALFARSQLAARAGDLDKASDFVDQAIAAEPGRADLLAWSGRLAVNQRDTEAALQRYEQAWQASIGDPEIAMAYAELLKRNNDPQAAQAILAGLPDTPEMRFARIVFALESDDRQSAEELYRGFADADYADQSNAAFQAAQSAEMLDHDREAVDWYKQVSGERSLRSIMRRAFLLADLNEVDEARNLLAQLRIHTDNNVKTQSYQAEAQILQTVGREQDAMDTLNKALDVLPEDVALRYMRALLAVGLGQHELAENDLRQIISVQPTNAAALNALGYTLADLTDRYAEAEPLILQAYELQPNESSIVDSMGWIAYRLGRLQEAEKYLRRAWNTNQGAEIAAHLGEVLWVSGQKDEARSFWQSGERLEADNKVLLETMQRFGESP
jgi:tetratricopeptide (TPR) repeat protein